MCVETHLDAANDINDIIDSSVSYFWEVIVLFIKHHKIVKLTTIIPFLLFLTPSNAFLSKQLLCFQ